MIIHETSIVHPSSKIDDSVEIGPFCIVGENVEIKKDTKLISHLKEGQNQTIIQKSN